MRSGASIGEGHDTSKDARTLAGGGSLRLVSAGVGLLSGLIVTVVLVRAFGSQRFGEYALVVSVTSLIGIVVELGLGVGVTRMAAFLDEAGARSWARTAFVLGALIGGVATIAAAIVAVFLGPPLGGPLLAAAPLVVIGTIWSVERGFLASQRRVVVTEGVSIFAQTVSLLAVVVVVAAGSRSPTIVIATQVGVRTLGVLILAAVCRKQLSRLPVGTRTPARTVLTFSLPLMVGGVAGTVLQRSDVVLIGVMVGVSAVGWYEPVLRVLDVAPLVIASLGFYFFPVGASLVARGDFARLQDAYVTITKWGMVLVMPLLLTMLLAPIPALQAVFGAGFEASRTVVAVLAIGYIANAVTGVNGGALVVLGATRQIVIRSVLLMTLNLVGNIVLIPSLGAFGAALATTGVTMLLNAFNSIFVWRRARLTPIRSDTVAYATATGLAAAVAAILAQVFSLGSSLAGSLTIFSSVALVGLATSLVTLRPGERRLLRSVVRAVTSPPTGPRVQRATLP
jgi:O-antigen/teichoic acid export membrane protein